MLDRRRFSAALVGLTAKAGRAIQGGFADSSTPQGHRLRDRAGFPALRTETRIPVLVVGGGIAGLSAAWRMDKRGFRDFLVLEMEPAAGGNARWGENEVSAYPWAAHYVPVPAATGAGLVRELMEDLGVLRDGVWEERHLCHSPQERLFLHGKWQEGLEPEIGATRRDHDEYRRFQALMAEFEAGGEFAIPMETGARRRGDLDRISFLDWLRAERFTSPYLHWYADYACRDDYGARAAQTSAWAGIHYFAARGHASDKGPLTWPEGNGWITRRLLERVGRYVRTAAMVHRIEPDGRGWRVAAGDTLYRAGAVIFAAPTFLARYLMDAAPAFPGDYSPWLTANLTLDRLPAERGLEAAWDNVIYRSPALGYVVATHQSLRTRIDRSVWTYYWALADQTPAAARRMLIEKDWAHWRDAILADLEQAHPGIRECVVRIDVMRLGHAMIRPSPGFLFSAERARAARPAGTLVFAHSDLTGLSLFEEAQYRGVRAADHVLRLLGRGRV